jgi:hypothetical protein
MQLTALMVAPTASTITLVVKNEKKQRLKKECHHCFLLRERLYSRHGARRARAQ